MTARPTAPPRIAAIVCTCRRHDRLAECLASLEAQALDRHEYEIVVIDNSVDTQATSAFDWPGGVRVVVAGRAGLSHARNLGLAATEANLVAFLDDDAHAEPDWLETILGVFAQHPQAGAVGGRVAPIWPAPRPDWLDASHDGFLSIVDHGSSARALAPHEWLAGTNVAFRRACLPGAAPFAEHLGRFPGSLLSNEEIALLAGLRAAGHAVRYDPAIVVRHRIAPERLSRAWMRRRVAWQAVSDLLLAGDGAAPPFDPAALWGRVGAYLATQPPALRGAAGFFRDFGGAAEFRAQTEAIDALLRLLASHGELTTSAAAPESSRSAWTPAVPLRARSLAG